MMFKGKSDFITRAKADNKTITDANTRMEKEIRRLYKNYKLQIAALIRDPSLFTKEETFNLAAASKTITDMTKLLEEAGRDDLISAYVDEFPAITVQARQYFKQFGDVPELGGASSQAIEAYVEFSTKTLVQRVDVDLVQPLQQGIFQATFGNMPRDTVIDTVLSISDDLSPRNAETLVNDSFRQYQRGVTNLTGEELGLEVFWYQGPDDDVTSEQCDYILNNDPHDVPGMYLKDEISIDMVPGMTLAFDPMTAGGHFNCRHKFFPITLEFAESMGFKQ